MRTAYFTLGMLTVFLVALVGTSIGLTTPDYSPGRHYAIASHYTGAVGMTCACRLYPVGTRIRVTRGYRVVVVTVISAGPAVRFEKQGRLVDLSTTAFKQLCPVKPDQGLFPCVVQSIQP